MNELKAVAVENSGQAGGFYPRIVREVSGRQYDATPYSRSVRAPFCRTEAEAVAIAAAWIADMAHTAAVLRQLEGF